jgi:hypothetical protein
VMAKPRSRWCRWGRHFEIASRKRDRVQKARSGVSDMALGGLSGAALSAQNPPCSRNHPNPVPLSLTPSRLLYYYMRSGLSYAIDPRSPDQPPGLEIPSRSRATPRGPCPGACPSCRRSWAAGWRRRRCWRCLSGTEVLRALWDGRASRRT